MLTANFLTDRIEWNSREPIARLSLKSTNKLWPCRRRPLPPDQHRLWQLRSLILTLLSFFRQLPPLFSCKIRAPFSHSRWPIRASSSLGHIWSRRCVRSKIDKIILGSLYINADPIRVNPNTRVQDQTQTWKWNWFNYSKTLQNLTCSQEKNRPVLDFILIFKSLPIQV